MGKKKIKRVPLERKIDGKKYNYVGGGPKTNVEARKKSWKEKGYSVRIFKGSGGSRRIYVRKKR